MNPNERLDLSNQLVPVSIPDGVCPHYGIECDWCVNGGCLSLYQSECPGWKDERQEDEKNTKQ